MGVNEVDAVLTDNSRQADGRIDVPFTVKRQRRPDDPGDVVVASKKLAVFPPSDQNSVSAFHKALRQVACLLFSPAPATLFIQVKKDQRTPFPAMPRPR